jgi:hypothetical protein
MYLTQHNNKLKEIKTISKKQSIVEEPRFNLVEEISLNSAVKQGKRKNMHPGKKQHRSNSRNFIFPSPRIPAMNKKGQAKSKMDRDFIVRRNL